MIHFENSCDVNVKASGPPRTLKLPLLLPPQPSTNQQQIDGSSPRRCASVFTQKRNGLEQMGTQSELMSALVPLTQLFAASKSPAESPEAPKPPTPAQLKPKRKRIRPKTERRREQCRNNQARYRNRQRGIEQELESSVNELRQEIRKLTIERRALCYGVQTKTNAWSVVVEYFHIFRFGFLVPMLGTEHNGAQSPTPPADDQLEQECFLRAVMAPDVVLGEVSGVDVLIEQWQRYSSYFGRLCLQLNGMEQQSNGRMTTSATLSLTVTENSLQYVFPHLLDSNEGERISSRLLGQRLDCRCTILFLWDDTVGRVAQLECTLDLLTPLLRMLGNLDDVNCVFEKARVSPSYLIGLC